MCDQRIKLKSSELSISRYQPIATDCNRWLSFEIDAMTTLAKQFQAVLLRVPTRSDNHRAYTERMLSVHDNCAGLPPMHRQRLSVGTGLSLCTFNLASGSREVQAGSGLRNVAIRERTAAQITLK